MLYFATCPPASGGASPELRDGQVAELFRDGRVGLPPIAPGLQRSEGLERAEDDKQRLAPEPLRDDGLV